jgi:hypothetical protein
MVWLIAACAAAFGLVTGAGLAGIKHQQRVAATRQEWRGRGWYTLMTGLLLAAIGCLAVAAMLSFGYGGGGVAVYVMLGVFVNGTGVFMNLKAKSHIMWLALAFMAAIVLVAGVLGILDEITISPDINI